MTGRAFGTLTLRKRVFPAVSGPRRVYWECDCVCGATVTRRQDYLLARDNPSCGCRHSAKLNSGPMSPKWRGCGEISAEYFCSVRTAAGTRDIPFGITIEEAWGAFVAQGNRCAISGLPIRFPSGSRRRTASTQTASIDRKDSSLGYTPDNIWWVHKVVNQMKNHFPEDVFEVVCNAVATYRPREVDPSIVDAAKGTRNATTSRKRLRRA